ncbi:MAG TPA: hypothetical protein VI299_20290 [Polyangiales bacterium]
MRSFVSDPMFVFLVVGLGLYVLFQQVGATEAQPGIVVDEATVRYYRASFTQEYKRPPSAAELTNLLRKYIEDEAMYREAVRLGMDRHDAIVRRRLVQMIEFMYQDRGEPQLDAACAAHDPGDAPQRVLADFEQRFYADNEGPVSETGMPTREPDSFPLGSVFTGMTRENVNTHFGSAVTKAVFELSTNVWHGPFSSAYGRHWIRVSAREAAVDDGQHARERVLRCKATGRKDQLAEAVRGLIQAHGVTLHQEVGAQLPGLLSDTAEGARARTNAR